MDLAMWPMPCTIGQVHLLVNLYCSKMLRFTYVHCSLVVMAC